MSQLSSVHTLLSSQDLVTPAQPVGPALPPPHWSESVHALPSLHVAPGNAVWPHVPVAASQLSAVQAFVSSQFFAMPGVQTLPTHASPSVHALPSSQLPWTLLYVQPVLGSQLSDVHVLLSSQFLVLPVQVVSVQASATVQALPSLQAVPFSGLLTQLPLVVSQLSDVQPFWSLQSFCAPEMHTVSMQLSPTVHGLPSSQPVVCAACSQPTPAAQVSNVHGLLSSQLTAWPTHLPMTHVSPLVQKSPSVQALSLSLTCTHKPLIGSQLSDVQAFLSSQSTFLPGTQLLSMHVSPTVQALPSLHGIAGFSC